MSKKEKTIYFNFFSFSSCWIIPLLFEHNPKVVKIVCQGNSNFLLSSSHVKKEIYIHSQQELQECQIQLRSSFSFVS
jgi:hypothetical protein